MVYVQLHRVVETTVPHQYEYWLRVNFPSFPLMKWMPYMGAKQGGLGGGSQPPLNFGEGGSTPPDFEKKNLIAHLYRTFLIV